jgi:hypothetical protein
MSLSGAPSWRYDSKFGIGTKMDSQRKSAQRITRWALSVLSRVASD